jgi:hypothetical protein
MNPSIRQSIAVVFALTTTCLIARAQISGVGTTGVTAGSGRGTGSGGVMIGTGPDVPFENVGQLYGGRAQRNITTATTTHIDDTSTTKKESRNSRKHSSKNTKRSQSGSTPVATDASGR